MGSVSDIRTGVHARRLVLSILLLMVLLPGCAKSDIIDPVLARPVRDYAVGLQSALGAVTLEEIRPHATPQQVDRVRLYVVMLTEEKRLMPSARLVSQQIVSTSLEGRSGASVIADEKWVIVYTDRDTGETVNQEETSSRATYRMRAVDGAWYVDEVTTE